MLTLLRFLVALTLCIFMIEYIPSWMVKQPLISRVANLRLAHLDNTRYAAYAQLSSGDVLLLVTGKIGVVLCPYSKNQMSIDDNENAYYEHVMLIL